MIRISFSALILLGLFSKAALAEDPARNQTQQKNLSSQNGRFVFGQISGLARDQYMLDTQTGKLWQLTLSDSYDAEGKKNGTYTFLNPIGYQDWKSGTLKQEP